MRKEDFPILKQNLIYLDNSATTQKPKQVIEAIKNYYENYNSNVHRGFHRLSIKATMAYDDARKTVADFIKADPEEVIFTSGTTESLNLLAKALVKPGEEILLTEMEHHSNLVPWQQLAKERKATVKFIPVTSDFKLNFKSLITKKTKIVSVTHMSNVLGTINPIKEIARLAHRVGAVLVVDAAQSVPHLSVDVKDLDCDFLVFSGHKLCGPTGIGVLYGKKQLLEKMSPVKFGGGMIKEVTKETSTWADLPEKFEAGTPNIAGAIGLAAAIDYLQQIGMEKISKHSQELTQYALTKLSLIPGLDLFGPKNNRGPIFSFSLKNVHTHDLSQGLDNANIAVRAGNHCAMPLAEKIGTTVRASFYLYNTKEDVDALVEALGSLYVNKNEISSGELTEEQEIYKENLLDHYRNPHNKGKLNQAIVHQEYNRICGDNIKLFLKTDKDNLQEVKWQGNGCAISQASISLLSDELMGLSLQEAKNINEDKVLQLLGIPISHTRIKCALLSLKTLKGALK